MKRTAKISHQTERKICAFIIIAASGCVAFGFYGEGLSGFRLYLTAVIVLALKFGELTCAADINFYLARREIYKAVAFTALAATLYFLSVTAVAFSWMNSPQKGIAQLESANAAVKTAREASEIAASQLAKCNPSYIKKCVKPMTDLLTQKQANLDVALKNAAALADVKASQSNWNQIAGFFGTNRATLEFSRDIILGALFDLLGMIFYAQSAPTSKKKQGNKAMAVYREPSDHAVSRPVVEDVPVIENTLLADIADDLTTLIVCPKQGVGKTSLMGAIALERTKRGDEVVILDAHFYRENWKIWHPDLKILGKGKNYPEIQEYLESLKEELDRRYNSSADFRNITVIMDEMATTCSEVKANEYFLKLLTEGRKSGIFFVGATHSTTVKSIGLEGNGQLKTGFSSILYMEDNFTIERVVFNARGNEISKTYQHPGKLDFSHLYVNPPCSLDSRTFADDGEQPEILPQFQQMMTSVLDVKKIEETKFFDKVNLAFDKLAAENPIKKPSYSAICRELGITKNAPLNRRIDDALAKRNPPVKMGAQDE
jgi:hypothetical protein